jgi:hypothetical protein
MSFRTVSKYLLGRVNPLDAEAIKNCQTKITNIAYLKIAVNV